MRQVGNILYKARKSKEYTYNDVHDRLSISQQTIKNWEAGRNLSSIMKFLDYMDELNLDPMTLIK